MRRVVASASSVSFPILVLGGMANLTAILLGFMAFARYGKAAFRQAVKDEVKPALDALQAHTDSAKKSQKKSDKRVKKLMLAFQEHTNNDDSRFGKIFDLIDAQKDVAAEKVTAVATVAAERVVTTAVDAAVATRLAAREAADAASKVAEDRAEQVAQVAAAKAVALIDEARRSEK